MAQINLKFGSNGALEPEDDDISNAYMLSRQVAHEYHSSATQSYINAETAAQQVAAEAAMDEQAKFKKEQSKKQAEGKAAASSFAEGMTEQGKKPDEIQSETGGLEAPMIDPTQAAAAGAGAAFKLSMSAGNTLMPSLARAVTAGVVNTVTDPLYGTAAEVVGASNPSLALPFNLAMGLLGGMTLEPAIERGIVKAAAAGGRVLDAAGVAEQVQMMRGVLANEVGAVGKIDDLTKRAVIEELNTEIEKVPVADTIKASKAGVPAPQGDMTAKTDQFTANKNPDITQETAGNIRLWGADLEPKFMGQIETPEDIMRVISGTDEAFKAEREIARRGTRSWEDTESEAKKYKLEDLLGRKQGQALNAEQVDNARTLLVSSADTLRGMAQVVSRGEANDLQKADFMRAFNVHYAIQMQLSGAAAEAGRALQIFRKVATSDTLRVGQLKDFLASTADKKITPESIANALSTMTTPAQVSNYVKQAKRATTWDMFIEAWINGLLSGPVTHAVNTTSNALTSIWMIPERALASGLSKLHGGDIRAGEVAAQAYGLVTGAKDGFKLAWQALKSGETSDIMGKVEQQQNRAISAKNVQELPLIKKLAPNAFQEGGIAAWFVNTLGEGFRLPGRFLGAEDEFFKSIGYRMELHAQAFRKAAQEGLEGTEAAQRMQAIIADPQNLAPDVHLAAIDAARYQTFTSELGKGGKGIQAAANYIPGAKLVVPFIRTPANIMKFALERNLITAPFFKQVRADIMAGGPRMDMALSRIAMGSMGMGVVASYAASGAITGGGPSDTDLRSHKYNTGWQPYSIKIGDKYYAYGRLEPLGMMMGLAADAVEIMGELDEMESDKIATTIVAAIGKNVMSKTWLRGMSEMINAMEDPDRYGSKYVKQLARTGVPTLVAQIERTMYPELSDAQSALDAMKARIPGFSNELPARRNLWGEKIQFNGALGPDIISPIFTSKEKDSPIDKELLRMKAPVKMPGRTQTFEGVPTKLDAYEYEEFMVRMNGVKIESTGKTLKKSLNELVTKDKDYKAIKDDRIKEKMIEAYIDEARSKAKIEMLETNHEIRRFVDNEHRIMAAAQ